MALAQSLLYGRRPIGSGPSLNLPDVIVFNDLWLRIRDNDLPRWLKSEGFSIADEVDNFVHPELRQEMSLAFVGHPNMAEPIRITIYRRNGQMSLALSYDDEDWHGDGPGSDGERLLLKTLASNLSNDVHLEFDIVSSEHLSRFLASYPDDIGMALSLAPLSFSDNGDENSRLNRLAERADNAADEGLLRRARSLQELLASEGGAEALAAIIDYGTIYLTLDLTAFNR